jgi:D-serine deaminase-like pyridoxal phosphate-dependent protein
MPEDIDTPCLVADGDRVKANITRMQVAMNERGIRLRPHAKTHKSVAIAGMQLAAGASGITVGTLGEAETFAAAGCIDVFIAYPIWASERKAVRLRALADRIPLKVGIDSVAGSEQLGAAVRDLQVLIEIDSGEHRTGVPAPKAAEVAAAATRAGLEVVGVYTHGGHAYEDATSVISAADDEVSALGAAVDALGAMGLRIDTASAGSTPTALRSARGCVTEERPGTYVFGDRQQVSLGAAAPEDVALFVLATVVGIGETWLVLDCGAKTLSKDRKPWMPGHGILLDFPGLTVDSLYDYHAVVPTPPGVDAPKIGERVTVVPNHVCPVVNLFDRIHVAVNGQIVDIWPVDARGKNA